MTQPDREYLEDADDIRDVKTTGINWTFAPCVAVPRDDRWGRTCEGFAEDPQLVAVLGEAAVRGLQYSDLGHPESVLACAKHFIGDGGTVMGTGCSHPAVGATDDHWRRARGE